MSRIGKLTLTVGAFGLVKIGWMKTNPSKKYAIKSMKKHEIIQSKHVDHIENEKTILSKLDHPFGVSTQKLDEANREYNPTETHPDTFLLLS